MIVSPDQMMAMLAPQAAPQPGEMPAPSGAGEKWQMEMERASRSLSRESSDKSGAGLALTSGERSTRGAGTVPAGPHDRPAGERQPWQPGKESAVFEHATLQQQKPAKPTAATAGNAEVAASKPSEGFGARVPAGKNSTQTPPTRHQSSNLPVARHQPDSSTAPGSKTAERSLTPSPINLGSVQTLPGVVKPAGTSMPGSGSDEKLGATDETGAAHGLHPEKTAASGKHRHGVKGDAVASVRASANADRPAGEVQAQIQTPSLIAGNQANVLARRAQATSVAAITQSKDKLESADPAPPVNPASAKDQPPPAPLNQHTVPPPIHQAFADKGQHDMSYGAVYSSAQDADPAADPFPSKLMHTFQENGDVQVWIRDAELSLPQAYVIARNLGSELSGTGYRLNSLMLNGKKVGSLFEGNMYADIDAPDQGEAS